MSNVEQAAPGCSQATIGQAQADTRAGLSMVECNLSDPGGRNERWEE
ncbi:MAG: hypothetical protein ACREOH_05180 [Candidatus Entotheonellia bacterium]